MDDLQSVVERFESSAEHLIKTKALIYRNLLRESTHLDGGNFTKIHSSDLWRLFEEYEQYFFDSSLHLYWKFFDMSYKSLCQSNTPFLFLKIVPYSPNHSKIWIFDIHIQFISFVV